jgi:hypothetical protein
MQYLILFFIETNFIYFNDSIFYFDFLNIHDFVLFIKIRRFSTSYGYNIKINFVRI